MKCEIIAVGTEILMGQITNTNARDLAVELLNLGVGVYYQTVVGDNELRLEEVIRRSLERADLIIFTGGLGPTEDDLTRETLARVLGLPLEYDQRWGLHLQEFFERLGRPMTESNRRQAYLPQGAKLLPNARGTAPGIYLEKGEKLFVLLPGPPQELRPILREQVVPLLGKKLAGSGRLGVIRSKVLRVAGLGESAMAEMIKPILDRQDNPTIAPLAKISEVHLRITARAAGWEEADRLIAAKKKEIEEILGDYIYGEDEAELEEVVARLLLEKGQSVAAAESSSGGLLCHLLTNVPGSSAFFPGGFVTYSDQSKIKVLGVQESLLNQNGAVSAEAASAMAAGARLKSGAGIGIGITGIAGPGGGTEGKPVGLTYLALEAPAFCFCRRYEFWGSRAEIKLRAVKTALNLLRLYLLGKLS